MRHPGVVCLGQHVGTSGVADSKPGCRDMFPFLLCENGSECRDMFPFSHCESGSECRDSFTFLPKGKN